MHKRIGDCDMIGCPICNGDVHQKRDGKLEQAWIDFLGIHVALSKNPETNFKCGFRDGYRSGYDARTEEVAHWQKKYDLQIYKVCELSSEVGRLNGVLANHKLYEEYENEIANLKKIIAKELSENDELGCEFVYVGILKAQADSLAAALEFYASPESAIQTSKRADDALKQYRKAREGK